MRTLLLTGLLLLTPACGSAPSASNQPRAMDNAGRDGNGGPESTTDDAGNDGNDGLASNGEVFGSQPPGALNGSGGAANGGTGTLGWPNATCVSSCPIGQVCCLTILPSVSNLPPVMASNCQTGPCPSQPVFGSLQVCSSTAECLVTGDYCGPLPGLNWIPGMICNAPHDASSPAEGGRGDGGNPDAG